MKLIQFTHLSCSAHNDADFRKRKIHLSNELDTNQSKQNKSSNNQHHQATVAAKIQRSDRMQKEIDSLKSMNKQLAEKAQVWKYFSALKNFFF